MEHLALLNKNLNLLDLRVPFVADDYDDDGQFQLFGVRRGYASVQDLVDLHVQQPHDFNCLVQTWLFFGLLRQLFGPDLDPMSFVHEDESGPRINTECLREHCDSWLSDVPKPDQQQLANARVTNREEPYHLPDILDADTQHTADAYRRFLWELAESLAFCAELSDKLDESIQCPWHAESRRILLSVKLLVEALRACFDHAVDLFQPLWSCCCLMEYFMPEVLVTPPLTPRPGVFLETFLLEKGWCPCRLSAISSATSAQSLYLFTGYAAQDLIGTGHTECTKDKCQVDALADDSAEHAPGCPGHDSCRLISVPVQKLIDTYKQGHIPLLSSAVGDSGHLDVQVVSSNERPRFAAISHVWSDGLKNDHGNALYECQLLGVHQELDRLSRHVDARPEVSTIPRTSSGKWFYMIRPRPPTAHTATRLPPVDSARPTVANNPSEGEALQVFWLDVLCIPRGRKKDEYLEERGQAIGKIDWIFASAEKVLVRDRVLKDLFTDGMSSLELAAHICSSKWLSRCWTLAEGALAWDWTIQFADRTMTFVEILRMAEAPLQPELVVRGHFREASVASYDVLLQRRLQTGLLASVYMIPYDRTYKSRTNRRFAANWNSLLARTTSWNDDILLILGLVVKVSILDLVPLHSSLRMKAILNTLGGIPAALLFNTSPKVQNEPRNLWVPIEIGIGSDNKLGVGSTINTYTEGRMVGPLDGEEYVLYRFCAVDSYTFTIFDNNLSNDETDLTVFHVTLRAPPPTLVAGQDIIVVLPYGYGNNRLLDTSCLAFIGIVQLEKGHRYLVRWQCLADVRRLHGGGLPEEIESVQCTRLSHSAHVYVECDMTNWPISRALNSYLSPDQSEFWIIQLFELPNHPKQLCWTIAVILALHAGILAEAVSDSVISRTTGGFLLAFSALGVLILSVFSSALTSSPMDAWRGRPEYGGREAFDEYKGKAQQEWAELFRPEPDRASSSLRYRLLKRAQGLPSMRQYAPNLEDSETAARAVGWLAMTNDLLRTFQFVTALIITGLGGYMFHKELEDAPSLYIIILASLTAAWIPLAWASSRGAFEGQLTPSPTMHDPTEGVSNRERVDIFLIPFWFGAWTALAKWAATRKAQATSVGTLATIDALLLWILCCLIVVETAIYNIRDSVFVKHPASLDLLFNVPDYLLVEEGEGDSNILSILAKAIIRAFMIKRHTRAE